MIFKETHHLIPEHKWQTRRPVKPGDMASHDEKGNIVAVYRKGRLLWKVGRTYAKQSGRGKKAVGRTPPVKAIRREGLQEISDQDLRAEGLGASEVDWAGYLHILGYFEKFKRVWNSLYRKPYRWEDDPDVWVLEFEREEATEASHRGIVHDPNTGKE